MLTTLSGRVADRVPVTPFVKEKFLSYIRLGKAGVDSVHYGAACARDFGIDLMARPKKFERPDFFRRSYPAWNVSAVMDAAKKTSK